MIVLTHKLGRAPAWLAGHVSISAAVHRVSRGSQRWFRTGTRILQAGGARMRRTQWYQPRPCSQESATSRSWTDSINRIQRMSLHAMQPHFSSSKPAIIILNRILACVYTHLNHIYPEVNQLHHTEHMLWQWNAMFGGKIHSNHVIITSLDKYLPPSVGESLYHVLGDDFRRGDKHHHTVLVNIYMQRRSNWNAPHNCQLYKRGEKRL